MHDNASRQVGLKINNVITKVVRFNSNTKTLVKINGQEIVDVDTFTYLKGFVTSTGAVMKTLPTAYEKIQKISEILRSSKCSIHTR